MIPTDISFKAQRMCGNTGVVSAKYPYFPHLLIDEIINRVKNNHPFAEEELWYLLFILIESAYYIHKSDKIVGDIRPLNIFINEDGEIKIATRYTFINDE
jgi:serine/threonine protein kinase